jgi:competence protein ComEC
MPRQLLINGVEFCFLYPPADFLVQKASQKCGDISFLFAGDIMAEAEQELLDLAGADLACDVLLVPHHGSRTSSSQSFLASVQPDVEKQISISPRNRTGGL